MGCRKVILDGDNRNIVLFQSVNIRINGYIIRFKFTRKPIIIAIPWVFSNNVFLHPISVCLRTHFDAFNVFFFGFRDIHALEQNYISIVPIQYDLTASNMLEKLNHFNS